MPQADSEEGPRRQGRGRGAKQSIIHALLQVSFLLDFNLAAGKGERGGGREEWGKGRVGEKGVGSCIAIHPSCSAQYIASQNCMFRQALKCCAQVFGNTWPSTGVPILTELHKVGSVRHGLAQN